MNEFPPLFPDNDLLRALPARDALDLAARLERTSLAAGDIVFDAGKIDTVFFPTSSVITKIVRMDDGSRAEAGIVGREGMVPLCLFMHLDASPFRGVVQNPGDAWRMSAGEFREVVRPGTALHARVLRFAASFMAQLSQSAGCARLHSLEKRYCRWLLMTLDRVGASEFELKQDVAAAALGVRRMTITPVARKLQTAGLIRYRRGRIKILDRAGLEAVCCECYNRVRAIYADALPV